MEMQLDETQPAPTGENNNNRVPQPGQTIELPVVGGRRDGPQRKKRKAEEAEMKQWASPSALVEQIPMNELKYYAANKDIEGKPQLPLVSNHESEAIYQWRKHAPLGSYLGNRERGVNWYMRHPGRPACPTFLFKVAHDLESCEAMAYTLMHVMESSQADHAVIMAECPPDFAPPRRENHGDSQYGRPMRTPIGPGHRGRQNNWNPPAPAGANTNEKPDENCSNLICRDLREPHHFAKCVQPSETGGPIKICMNCNVAGHLSDSCSIINAVDFALPCVFNTVKARLVTDRARRPPFMSHGMNVYNFLVLLKRLDPDAMGQSADELCWTPGFILKVMRTSPGKGVLAGKKGPFEFSYTHHGTSNLPKDPLWDGKTLGDVADMWLSSSDVRIQMAGIDELNEGFAIRHEITRQLAFILDGKLLAEPSMHIDVAKVQTTVAAVADSTIIIMTGGPDDLVPTPAQKAITKPRLFTVPFADRVVTTAEGEVVTKIQFAPHLRTGVGITEERQEAVWAAITKMLRGNLTGERFDSECAAERQLAKMLREAEMDNQSMFKPGEMGH